MKHGLSRIGLLLALLLLAWCVMTFTHEAGHIVGGWLCGGTLTDYQLWPWTLPYSIFAPDPWPLVTLWSGPMVGVAVPLLFAAVLRHLAAWLVAHFCLAANGAYLAAAWISGDPYLDTPQLLAAGSWPMAIAAYCMITVGWGYIGLRRDVIAILKQQQTGPARLASGCSPTGVGAAGGRPELRPKSPEDQDE